MNWRLDFHLLHGIYPYKVGNFAEITLNKLHNEIMNVPPYFLSKS